MGPTITQLFLNLNGTVSLKEADGKVSALLTCDSGYFVAKASSIKKALQSLQAQVEGNPSPVESDEE